MRSRMQELYKKNKTVFNTRDLANIWQYDNYNSLKQRIYSLVNRGQMIRLRRGLYSLPDRDINELELGNKVSTPSYVSFERVLLDEGVIFQWSSEITLAAKKTQTVTINEYSFIFRQLKDEILLNKKGIINSDNYCIASKERAFLDMLYINPKFHFDNLRGMDFKKIENLAEIYKRKSLNKIILKLKKHAGSY